MMSKLLLVAAIAALTSCASSPGLINSEDDGRPKAFGCKNIDPEQTITEFKSDSYNTTWGSVWSAALRDSTVDADPVSGGTSVLSKMPQGRTYCLVLPDSEESVASVAYDTFRDLGIKFVQSNPESGEFVTETAEKSQGTNSMNKSRWRETYYIHVSSNIESGTDLRVYRDIRISRPSDGGWSRYIRETSNGNNETWVLLRINERLANGDNPSKPPKIGT